MLHFSFFQGLIFFLTRTKPIRKLSPDLFFMVDGLSFFFFTSFIISNCKIANEMKSKKLKLISLKSEQTMYLLSGK